LLAADRRGLRSRALSIAFLYLGRQSVSRIIPT
jgi:hypothetical protein